MKKIDGFVVLETGEIVEDGGSLKKGHVVLKKGAKSKKVECRAVYLNEKIRMTEEAKRMFISRRNNFFANGVLKSVSVFPGTGIMIKVLFPQSNREEVFPSEYWRTNWKEKF